MVFPSEAKGHAQLSRRLAQARCDFFSEPDINNAGFWVSVDASASPATRPRHDAHPARDHRHDRRQAHSGGQARPGRDVPAPRRLQEALSDASRPAIRYARTLLDIGSEADRAYRQHWDIRMQGPPGAPLAAPAAPPPPYTKMDIPDCEASTETAGFYTRDRLAVH